MNHQTNIEETKSNSELAGIIQESKERLNDTEQIAPKKRGRGRPAGTTNKTETVQPQAINQAPPPNITPALKHFTILAGNMIAARTKNDLWKISEDEANTIAEQGNVCAQEFAPMIDSKYMKLGAFTLSVGMVFGLRYYTYTEIIKQEQDKIIQEKAARAEHIDGVGMIVNV